MTNHEVVQKVIDLFEDPSNWCAGAAAVNSLHQQVRPRDSDACRWCVGGAFAKLSDNYREIFEDFDSFCYQNYKLSSISLNDEKGYAAILHALRVYLEKTNDCGSSN